jgi:DNA polymerase-3 subunit gamma/tau
MTEHESNIVSPPPAVPYRVLARKYRPTTFAQLIGQDVLVRTLTNAFRTGRLAQAYMLAGVRGVGKTTTARIIARGLNCIGVDGQGGPTAAPCGVCEHCKAIGEDRHIDVLEMDAASHTQVAKIRELLDGIPYRPASARFKVYIIDEVHMLSAGSFNALLKTLEEPPAHVRFVFATTEIRKVPVTVLSRCQRFDLRRIESAVLARHLGEIAGQEGVEVSPPALQMIARAADGSVRDGLSLLDQAIATASAAIDAETVRGMLGLADRTVVFDLFEALAAGEMDTALRVLADLHGSGSDPALVLEDLLDLCHWLTRIKVTPAVADGFGVAEAERTRGRAMAERLTMAELTRCWQMLLKGLGEVRFAPAPLQAAEMVLIRLAYAAQLPTPGEVVRGWQTANAGGRAPPQPAGAGTPPGGGPAAVAAPPAARAAAGSVRREAPRLRPADEETAPGVQRSTPSPSANAAAADVAGHPLVQAILETFPGATIDEVRSPPPPGDADAAADLDDDR